MKDLPKYPIIEWVSIPKNVKDALREYCIGQDLHPHNGTYIHYEVDEPNPNDPILCYLYVIGVVPEHEKALIHFDY